MKCNRLTVHKARSELPRIPPSLVHWEWFILLRIEGGKTKERLLFKNHSTGNAGTQISGFTHYIAIP